MPVEALRAIGADVEGALEHVNVPSYVIDRAGVVRWLNPAAAVVVVDSAGERVAVEISSVPLR
jgi:hypothetical protein